MRYALFAGEDYYPRGGIYDFRGIGTLDELKTKCATLDIEWAHIVGMETMQVVCHCDGMEWLDGADPWREED